MNNEEKVGDLQDILAFIWSSTYRIACHHRIDVITATFSEQIIKKI
jgi:hypothetical protein